MPWSMCTTRSPGDRAEASARKLDARRRRRGRARRSPRMSVSEMTARLVGLETGLQRQDATLRLLRIGGLGRLPIGRQGNALQPMVGQHRAQTVRRALRPGGEQHPLAGGGQAPGVVGRRLEEVDAVLQPARRRTIRPSLAPISTVPGARPRPGTGVNRRMRTLRQPSGPLLGGQVERFGLQARGSGSSARSGRAPRRRRRSPPPVRHALRGRGGRGRSARFGGR